MSFGKLYIRLIRPRCFKALPQIFMLHAGTSRNSSSNRGIHSVVPRQAFDKSVFPENCGARGGKEDEFMENCGAIGGKEDEFMEEIISSPQSRDILARTRIIQDPEECEEVVKTIIALGGPIGVDMEGTGNQPLNPTSLLQIVDEEGNIYLFRTGLNPVLLTKGRLKELLENPRIVKVIHGSSVDCISMYRDGVEISGLYDTSVAHRVLEFQNNGRSIIYSDTIGLNSLCTYCGLDKNPVKEVFKMSMMKLIVFGNVLQKAESLPQKLVVYCAWDVEQLLKIYNFLRLRIDPDFDNLVDQFSSLETLRAIDRPSVRTRRRLWRRQEANGLFLKNLSPLVSKDALGQVLKDAEGVKKIYISGLSRTAFVVMEEKSQVLDLVNKLSSSNILGEQVILKLMEDPKTDKEE